MPAPRRVRSQTVIHLQDYDTSEDIATVLRQFRSFRTWNELGLRGRSRTDYSKTYRFTDPGRLPEIHATLFRQHVTYNEYTMYLWDTPVAWYHARLGWITPRLGGFIGSTTQTDYDKARVALALLTGAPE